jgi:hypothetical protein
MNPYESPAVPSFFGVFFGPKMLILSQSLKRTLRLAACHGQRQLCHTASVESADFGGHGEIWLCLEIGYNCITIIREL